MKLCAGTPAASLNPNVEHLTESTEVNKQWSFNRLKLKLHKNLPHFHFVPTPKRSKSGFGFIN